MFERKVYKKLLMWKQGSSGEKALLIEGARRIGKSTIAEEFGKKEYKSYILIDFNDVSNVVKDAFEKYLNDLDTFFLILSTEYNTTLYPKESLIIFDEIQQYPSKAVYKKTGQRRQIRLYRNRFFDFDTRKRQRNNHSVGRKTNQYVSDGFRGVLLGARRNKNNRVHQKMF